MKMYFEDNVFQNNSNRIKNWISPRTTMILKVDQTLFLEHNQQLENIWECLKLKRFL